MDELHAINAGAAGWMQLVSHPPVPALLALAAGLLTLMALIAGAGLRLAVDRRREFSWRRLAADTSATATIEVTLVLLLLLFLGSLLAQTTLLATGHIMTHYAAYAAGRSMVVTIAADRSLQEPANTIDIRLPGKAGTIRQAAVMAMMPVSGRLGAAAGPAESPAEDVVADLTQHWGEAPRWLVRTGADRYRYADVNTEARLFRVVPEADAGYRLTPLADNPESFGPADRVVVQVRHRFNLGVPMAGVLFATGDRGGSHTDATATGAGPFRWIEAWTTMPIAGARTDLPPAPTYWSHDDGAWRTLRRETPVD